MRVLFLSSNPNTGALEHWLAGTGAVVQRHSNRLSIADLQEARADLVLSYNYAHIIPSSVLRAASCPLMNLHISFLPYNRGADPNLWSFLEDTPKGVTIHLVDDGIDTGPIIAQRALRFDESSETLASSYGTLHHELHALFREVWPSVAARQVTYRPQEGPGTSHRRADFDMFRHILHPEGFNIKIPELKLRYSQWKHSYEAENS